MIQSARSMWAARSAEVACVPKRTAKHLTVSKSGFLLTVGTWNLGLVSKSGFLLTADLWKTGLVSKSTLLLTAGTWNLGLVSESGFLLTERLWETGAVSIWAICSARVCGY